MSSPTTGDRNADEILPTGYYPSLNISQDDFIRPEKKFREDRKCVECGTPYTLTTPYEKCNPVIRDLCTDCIWKYQNSDRWT